VELGDDFAPCPWITAFVDKKALSCLICFENVELRGPTERRDGHVPALLPCGHVFGANCLSQWREGEGNRSCPNCRAPALIHPNDKCQHDVPPKILDAYTIFLAPQTLAEDKNCIPDKCLDCRWKEARDLFEDNLNLHRPDLNRLRAAIADAQAAVEKEAPGGESKFDKAMHAARLKGALRAKKKILEVTMLAFFSQEELHGW